MSRSVLPKGIIIGCHWPEPNATAAGRRMMQLIQVLAERYHITFACSQPLGAQSRWLDSTGVSTVHILLNHSSFDDWIASEQPQWVMFDRYLTEEQFGWRVEKTCPEAMRIIDTEDLHGLRKARETAHAQNRTFHISDLHNEVMHRELAAIYRSDGSLIISRFEMELLVNEQGVPKDLLFYLPFMEEPVQPEELPGIQQRAHCMTIGNFKHAPNRDAAKYLAHKLWPMIRQELPEAEFHLYGAYPDAEIMQLHNPAVGFLVKGRAEDVLQTMSQYRLCLAPLRFGAGLKGKLVDAMRSGTPSVTSAVGAEGMCKSAEDWNGGIEDEPSTFVQEVVRLYRDDSFWLQSQERGFNMLQSLFDGASWKKALQQEWSRRLNSLDERRLRNFTGAILRNQYHRSTTYMSKWIEEKNRNRSGAD
ncbi:MAG: glycosyltransferase [Cryomorphaceae bacterium]|nr:MAG: glycosyltransferase [Cryomorphaceae bacterium]